MNLFKTRLISGLLGYGLVSGALLAGVIHILQKPFDWGWYIAIWLFFMLIESLFINLVTNNSKNKQDKKLVNIYLLTKVIKIVCSLIFALTYVVVEKGENLLMFAIIFIIFYLLFLIAETILFSMIEKHIKLENKSNE